MDFFDNLREKNKNTLNKMEKAERQQRAKKRHLSRFRKTRGKKAVRQHRKPRFLKSKEATETALRAMAELKATS